MCRPVLFSILTQKIKESIIRHIVPGSSMVEQEAVNFEVAGSSPAPGANLDESPIFFVKNTAHNWRKDIVIRAHSYFYFSLIISL